MFHSFRPSNGFHTGQKYREIVAGSQVEPDFLPGTPTDHNGDDLPPEREISPVRVRQATAAALDVRKDRILVQSEFGDDYAIPGGPAQVLDTGKGVLGLKNGANAVAFIAGDEDGHAVDPVAFAHG